MNEQQIESVSVSGGAVIVTFVLMLILGWVVWKSVTRLARRWDAAIAADPCGHNRHEWPKWSEAAADPGYVSPKYQYRTCPRCGKTDKRMV